MTKDYSQSFPSFIVLGAQKAGTSTLDSWLREYPEICLPKGKETHFFSDVEKYNRGFSWYLSQFSKPFPGQIRGEVAPQYLYSFDAAERMSEGLFSPRFIVLLRHPIDRAYSNYLMSVRLGKECLSFHDALLQEVNRIKSSDDFSRNNYGYMSRSNYSLQINYYKKKFPDSPIHFALFEELMENSGLGDNVLKEITRFIGISEFRIPDRKVKVNSASEPRIKLLRDLLYGESKLKRFIGKFLITQDLRELVAHYIDKKNQRPISYSRPNIPRITFDECIKETMLTEKTTGLNLQIWHEITHQYKIID